MLILRVLVPICLLLSVDAQTLQSSRYQRHHPVPAPTPAPVPGPGSLSVADRIAADMAGVNEAHPHGVPLSWDFANGPFVGLGNNPGTQQAAVLWGAVYVASTGSTSSNTRINIRACQLWERQSDNTWVQAAGIDASIDAGLYAEDFSASFSHADIRREPDGTISTITTVGKTAHFYAPYPRMGFHSGTLVGWVSICQMRLILANAAGVDDRANAHFVASVGGDYYPGKQGPGIENNPAIAGGKFKVVTNYWRSFAMTTLTKAQLESNPPPVDLSGVLP